MPPKTLIFIGMSLGSIIGGYLPTIFGIDFFSFTAILSSGIGAIIGTWVGYKFSDF